MPSGDSEAQATSAQQTPEPRAPEQKTQKRADIHAAAIAEFSMRGFAGTSMANIAEAAAMSRPALYQYFKNKGDIFASAFIALLNDHVEAALAALHSQGDPGETNDAGETASLDEFLQRYEGDLWERMAASPHSEAIWNASKDDLSDAIAEVFSRLWAGLDEYLIAVVPGNDRAAKTVRSGWGDLIRLSPKGFKLDQPSVEVFRTRLSALARSISADIEEFQSSR